MEDQKEVAVTQDHEIITSPFASESNFVLAQRMAQALASSDMVPKAMQGKIGNVLLALELSYRIGMPVFAILQNIHIINGKPGFSSTFMIAVINKSGRYDMPLMYEFSDDRASCRCWTKYKGERVDGPWITMAMAKNEGWVDKNQSKWKTMPELMLCYRAAAFFARTNCPDLLQGGLKTTDELIDELPVTVQADTQDHVKADINQRFSAPKEESATTNPLSERQKKIDAFRAEIDSKETQLDLDQWRAKHSGRIEKAFPGDDAAYNEIISYANDRYVVLQYEEKGA